MSQYTGGAAAALTPEIAYPDPLELFRSRVEECGGRPRGGPDQYHAHCPNSEHDDRNPSFTFGRGHKGVVFTCHAGCPDEDVLRALDLCWADLFHERSGGKTAPDMDALLRAYANGGLKPVQPRGLRFPPPDAPPDARKVAVMMAGQYGLRLAVGERRPLLFAIVPNARRLGWHLRDGRPVADGGRKRMATAIRWLEDNGYWWCAERLERRGNFRHGTKCFLPRVVISLSEPRTGKRDVGDKRDVGGFQNPTGSFYPSTDPLAARGTGTAPQVETRRAPKAKV